MSGTSIIPNPWDAIRAIRRRIRRLETRVYDLTSPIKGVIMWQFDDCWYPQKEILDHMASQQQRATLAVTKQDLTSTFGYGIGHPTCLNIDDLLLAQHQGHEIANHTLNHIDVRAAYGTNRATQIDSLQSELISLGIDPPTTFIYPYGYRNAQTDRDLATRFRVFRYAGYGVNAIAPANRFRIGALKPSTDSFVTSSSGALRPDDVKRLIELAVWKPLVISLFTHLGPAYVGDEPTVEEVITLLDYAKSLGVPVLTIREIVEGLNNVPNASFEYGSGPRAGETYARIDGWPIFVVGNSAITEDIQTVTPYPGGDGTKALRMVITDVAQSAARGFRTPVSPGDKYLVSGRCYIDVGGLTFTVVDHFTRTVSNAWGTAATGGAYTQDGGAAGDYSVNGTQGVIVSNTSVVSRNQYLLTPSIADGEILVKLQSDKTPNSGNDNHRIIFRVQGGPNFDRVHIDFTASATAPAAPYLRLQKTVAGVVTTIQDFVLIPGLAWAVNTEYWVRVQFRGTTVRARAWQDGTDEPDNDWQLNFTGASVPTAAGGLGLGIIFGGTNTPITAKFDEFSVWLGDDQAAANGIRLLTWWIDGNGANISQTNSEWWNADSNGLWKFFGLYTALTAPTNALFMEVRIQASGKVGTYKFDHMVHGLDSLQPDGPLG